jgi:hypothetical protein
MAYYFGKAEKDQTNLLLAETYTQGSKRLVNDLQAGFNQIQTNPDKEEGWKNANILIEQGILRELRALNSISKIAGNDQASIKSIATVTTQMKSKQTVLLNELADYYKRLGSLEKIPVIKLNAQELAVSKKVPVNHAVLDTYFGKRSGSLDGVKLHPTMCFELFNFVDGKRSYYDIYKALKAEALAAGAWYYGVVTLEDVTKLLDANVEKGALVVK